MPEGFGCLKYPRLLANDTAKLFSECVQWILSVYALTPEPGDNGLELSPVTILVAVPRLPKTLSLS